VQRRGFLKSLALATVGFTILPPATTYQRIWKAERIVKFELVYDAQLAGTIRELFSEQNGFQLYALVEDVTRQFRVQSGELGVCKPGFQGLLK